MSDLKNELQTIDGVGEKTAEKIVEVVDEHGDSDLPEAVYSAFEHAEDGNARMAASYLAQVIDE